MAPTHEGRIILDTPAINTPRHTDAPPRARGRVRVAVQRRAEQTALAELHMSGSLKALFPQRRGDGVQAVLLNTAGGITGGDSFDVAIEARGGSDLSVTTQAAERIYRAPAGPCGTVRTQLQAGQAARLTWLPQETILFDGAALDRTLTIDAAPDATVLACETLIFGRGAMGETVRDLRLRDRVDLRIGGDLVFADRLRLSGDAQAQLDRAGVAAGARAVASVIYAAPDAALRLDDLRGLLPATCGASALRDNLVFLRLVAPDGYDLRQVLVPTLVSLSAADLPRPWMI